MSYITLNFPPSDAAPAWSSDTNFPVSASAWSATPTKVVPSGGQIAGGFVPATKPPATWVNWILATLGSQVRANSGWHVLNWSPGFWIPGTYFQQVNTRTFVIAMQSAASGGIPVLCSVATDGKTRRLYHESGTSLSDSDATIAAAATVQGLAAGIFSAAPTLAILLDNGAVRKSTDLGMTWSAAGSVAAGSYILHYFSAASKWLIGLVGGQKISYSGDLSTWTNATGASGAPTTPRAMASSSTAVIAVYHTSATVCARSLDGITWTLPTLSAGAHNWRGVTYSIARSAWMAVASDGVGALSLDNGLSWAPVALPAGAQDVAAFGRHFVAVCTNVHSGAGASIAISEDLGVTWIEYMIGSDPDANYLDRIVEFDGRLCVAGRGGTFSNIRAIFSLRAPWMPVP